MKRKLKNLSGAWSATPTPITNSLKIDIVAIKRMVKHHIRLGIKGLFVGGTCGEGPFMPKDELRMLTRQAAMASNGKLVISVQVTDNSAKRVLNNISAAKMDGADIAIVAEPWFIPPLANNVTFRDYYLEILEKSALPIGFYIRSVIMEPDTYMKLLMHPRVCLLKDSSSNKKIMRIAKQIAVQRENIVTMTGNEFTPPEYLRAGYSGILAGGGILTGSLLVKMVQAARDGDFKKVDTIQKICDRILYTAYGGKQYKSWLTGLKYALVKMGIFKTTVGYLKYPLTSSTTKKIDNMIEKEKDVLFP